MIMVHPVEPERLDAREPGKGLERTTQKDDHREKSRDGFHGLSQPAHLPFTGIGRSWLPAPLLGRPLRVTPGLRFLLPEHEAVALSLAQVTLLREFSGSFDPEFDVSPMAMVERSPFGDVV